MTTASLNSFVEDSYKKLLCMEAFLPLRVVAERIRSRGGLFIELDSRKVFTQGSYGNRWANSGDSSTGGNRGGAGLSSQGVPSWNGDLI